jgi:hypothetical protein
MYRQGLQRDIVEEHLGVGEARPDPPMVYYRRQITMLPAEWTIMDKVAVSAVCLASPSRSNSLREHTWTTNRDSRDTEHRHHLLNYPAEFR